MILGDTAQAVRKHSDDEDKGGGDLPPPGGKQKIIIINEQSVFFDSFQWISAQDFNGDISEIELNEEVFDSNAIAVKEFVNDKFGEIRCVMIDGEPWFVGKDVAVSLGYSNPRKALIDHIDGDDKMDGVTIRDSIGREQKPIFINESGLYSLILSSGFQRRTLMAIFLKLN